MLVYVDFRCFQDKDRLAVGLYKELDIMLTYITCLNEE